MAWPTFEIVKFDLADPALADLASRYRSVAGLATGGVPRSALGRCEADGSLTVIPSHRRIVSGWESELRTRVGGPLIRFASASDGYAVALDPASGEVLFVLDDPSESGGPRTWLMNASLAHLRATVKAVIDRFPFYDGPQSDERDAEQKRAQDELIRLIHEADPRADEEPGPWSEFPWDVGMGDFDTTSIVAAQ
jgi:hypothetical protein